jgi:hypothetical protein
MAETKKAAEAEAQEVVVMRNIGSESSLRRKAAQAATQESATKDPSMCGFNAPS